MHQHTSPARDRGAGVLCSLQAGRAIAAFGVMMSHAALATEAFVAPLPDWLKTIVDRGMFGVDFFFVLSGFIILNAHFDDIAGLGALKSYVVKRLSRIYMPYLPICLLVIAGYLLLPGLSGSQR